jgi:(R)-2-hydroxyacyl-CoA dehydratese activating ATPase
VYRVGLDLGSSYTKGVLVDSGHRLVDHLAVRTGYDFKAASRKILEHFKKKYELEYPVYSCGYGREQVDAEFISNSEIIALAVAVHKEFNEKVDVIDIGGQDTKYIRIADDGYVENFKMNRKCAAGTGAFLEEIAFRLGMEPDLFDSMARKSSEDIRLNSYCTVFAVSEIIGLIKNGNPMPDIIRGVYSSIVKRCEEMAQPINTLVFTGGVPDRHPMIVEMFAERWPEIRKPELPQFMAAFGCVLLSDKAAKAQNIEEPVAELSELKCDDCVD